MTITKNQQIIDNITDLYFDTLEKNCVEYTEYDEISGHSIPHAKDEYALKSVREMLEYIYEDRVGAQWLIDWAVENAGVVDTDTEYGEVVLDVVGRTKGQIL